MGENQRILVIGLDGATLDLIEPWSKAGYLPTLSCLMQTGVYGRLRSVLPVLSSAAWPSFATGMNPGKHGLFDFVRREPDSYRLRTVRRDHLRVPTLWNILSQHGRKVGVINVPMTYPPEAVNGFLISGLGTPNYKPFTYPPELGPELLRRGYQVNKTLFYHPKQEDAYLRQLYTIAEKQFEAAMWLMGQSAWDFFMMVFFDTDQIAHFFWRHMDATHPLHHVDRDHEHSQAILHFYQKLDGYIAQLIEKAGPGITTIVLSDHGEGPFYKNVYLNEWLRQKGYLVVHNDAVRLRGVKRIYARLGLTRERISSILRKIGLGRLERWIKDIMGDRIEMLPTTQRAEFPQAIDWERTRAYSFGYQGQIYINLKGREPQGIVEPGEEYQRLCADITRDLYALVDPEDQLPVVDRVLHKEEIFHGAYVDLAPDLTLEMRKYTYMTWRGYEFGARTGKIFTDPVDGLSGCHRPEGILFMSGPGIPSLGKCSGAEIIDLAPTILHLMDLPMPSEMDGKVLKDWIASERAVQVDHSQRNPSPQVEGASIWTDEDEKEMVDRLRSLGYL